MLTDEAFVAGEHTTGYLDEELDPERIADAVEKWGPEEVSSGGDDEEAIEREFTVEVNDKRFAVELEEHGASLPDLEGLDAGSDSAPGPGSRSGSQAAHGGDESAAEPDTSGTGNTVAAEMQGTVLSVDIEEGEEVAAGDVVLVLEAMKMENDITTDAGGTVTEIAVAEGDSVDMGDVLVVVE
jgi:acetyl-CoA/propionyl-CoA carboxylase biotin carboxyl carrier protein